MVCAKLVFNKSLTLIVNSINIHSHVVHSHYYNPSLGLATKTRACKGVGQKYSPRITFYAFGNVGE